MSMSAETAAAAAAIEVLLDRMTERISDRVDAVREFARAYTRRLPPEELGQLSTDELCGEVLGAFRLADERGVEEVAVRTFNPTLAEDGYQALGSVLETASADLPFLVDSVDEELQARGLRVRRVVHPVMGVERGPDTRIVRVTHARGAPARESVMHFEVDHRLDDEQLRGLADAVRGILRDVGLAARDFGAMREAVDGMVETAEAGRALYGADEVAEAVSFLQWLLEDNFVFLGYREYDIVDTPEGRALVVVPDSGLGILSKPGWSSYEDPVPLSRIEPNLRARIEGGDLLIYSKTNRPSTVHRRERMDYIGVRRVSPDGRVVGEVRMVGLFTRKAYVEPARRTPLLARKLRQILEAEDLIEGSHDFKAAVSTFESFPKDELFAGSVEHLRASVMGLLRVEEQQGIRLFVRPDLYGRSASLLVALPRDQYTAELRPRLEELFLRRYGASRAEFHLSLGEGKLAQLHFNVHVEGRIPSVLPDELEREVLELVRTWDERLKNRLVALFGRERGHVLCDRWAARFPDYYRSATDPELAAFDVARLEDLEAGDEAFVVGLVNRERAGETLTRVRLYKVGGKIQLSDFAPLLEALGLRVVEEVPTQLAGGGERFLHDFGVLGPDGHPLDVEVAGGRIADCIAAVWRGEVESDSLNRLVVSGGLTHHQVHILRAYRNYHQRVSAGFTADYKNDAFAAHPHIAAKLIRLFGLMFDPTVAWDPEGARVLREEILADLDAVASLEQDRILRNHLGLIDATLRTNAFRPGRGCLSLKFRSSEVPEMPRPTPRYEVFVYSPEVEAVHLRAGRVARGGIRWSDRQQDYRTEVLDLMKAQEVKNAVIVPTGSKGGFILKRRPQEPEALREEVRRQFVTFMRGLLDVTDNLVDGKVVHPPDARVHDEDDPYLVVAADRGTAALSDTANEVAAEYGFWLGDAFASGGSTGYDHRQLGITARGAWESVKRHFREIGTDPDEEPITVVGVGDMSGDVFGNGMLRSDQICLVAAFDHRHVFIDPNPVPAAGHAERKRLFELPGSTWDDYDRSKISSGGGVWSRRAKRIPLSPEARGALGVEGEWLTPDEVIRAILKAPVDLLWNGGIGTFVKASTESHADVGDRANDAVRVDAPELRCRVVAEAGNLGFTQPARVEYASQGGRINADFIDNSAGVDCSDHEVNLKILLGMAVRRGLIDLEERNRLLQEAEGDVVRLVLYDNFLQAQILSQEVELSSTRMEAYEDLMQSLERDGDLDRELWALPAAEEMAERHRAGRGLTRPELAVLLAFAKRSLSNALLASPLPDEPYLERDLRGNFPPGVVERFPDLVGEHPLRRELIATIAANDVINSMGITFVSRTVSGTGAEPAEVVRAYRIARDVTGAVGRWEAVEALVGTLEPAVVGELMVSVDRLVEVTSRWFLARAPGAMEEAVEGFREPFERLSDTITDAGSEAWRSEREREVHRLVDRGVPDPTARRHAYQTELIHGPDIIAVAEESGRSVGDVAPAFFRVGEAVDLGWLQTQLEQLPASSRWHRWALEALEDDLLLVRRLLVSRVIAESGDRGIEEAVEAYLERRAATHGRLRRFMRALALEGVRDLAPLTVAIRHIRTLIG